MIIGNLLASDQSEIVLASSGDSKRELCTPGICRATASQIPAGGWAVSFSHLKKKGKRIVKLFSVLPHLRSGMRFDAALAAALEAAKKFRLDAIDQGIMKARLV